MANVILAVFAHPDDEVLACGGTLARYAREGATVRVLTFTDGVSSRGWTETAASRRREEYVAACALLGAKPVWGLLHPDQQLDTVPQLVLAQQVENVVAAVQPTTVITHWLHDLNADHRAIAQAVLVATRPVAGSCVRRVLAAEIPESTSQAFGAPVFAPTVYVALTGQDATRKAQALDAYQSEARPYPHPRSLEAVLEHTHRRGGEAGVARAEAFALLREIV